MIRMLRDALTHAFPQTPAKNCRRARVTDGPYRSKYDIRLFLITLDGVREVTSELDFEHIELVYRERTNFRFDAVSSVHVVTPTELSCNLALALMNGEPRDIHVSNYVPADNMSNGIEGSAVEMSLDAIGFAHTLHILEGIAAEGKAGSNATSTSPSRRGACTRTSTAPADQISSSPGSVTPQDECSYWTISGVKAFE
jgi:hypothetical protein